VVVGKDAVVVLSSQGKVINAWAKNAARNANSWRRLRMISAADKEMLREIIWRRRPRLATLVVNVENGQLSEDAREEIREVLAEELCSAGLDPSDAPNQRGLAIERLIDEVGYL
jgi:hypothetical protein